MADRNETDALFATKRKKQQEEQAEQERREEMIRKKAEMEAEIRRLEEEAKRQKEQQEEARRQAEEEARRQKEQQEEARRQAEEEARRVQEEVREAEARVARMEEMAKQVQTKQEEAPVWQPAQIAEKAKKVRVQLGTCVQLGKIKVPLLYLVVGGLVVIVAVIIFAVVLASKPSEDIVLTGEDVYGINFNRTASAKIFDYNVYYPDSFEEGFLEGGALFTYGSAGDEDFSYVNISGVDMDSVQQAIGSTDPAELVHFFEENTLGAERGMVYEATTDSGRTAYSTDYHLRNISKDFTDIPEDVWAHSAVMVLETVEGEGYLIALYGTVSEANLTALDETVARFLDHTS